MTAVVLADTLWDSDPPRYEKIRQELHGPTIYGQLVDPIRIDGAGSDALRAHPARGSGFVFVPWGLASDCSRRKWSRSHRWMPVGDTVLLWASARPPDRWIDGLPTFDVRPGVEQPYPQETPSGYGKLEFRRQLTTDELSSLLPLLPSMRELGDAPDSVYARLARWRDAHLEASSAYPAYLLLGNVFRSILEERARRTPTAFAGTYALRVSVEDSVHSRLTMEIAAYPAGVQPRIPAWEGRPEPPNLEVPVAFDAAVRLGPVGGEMSDGCGSSLQIEPDVVGLQGIEVLAEARAHFEVVNLVRCFPGDPFFRRMEEAWSKEWQKYDEELPDGRIEVDERGGVRFSQVIEIEGVPTVFLEAVRHTAEDLSSPGIGEEP